MSVRVKKRFSIKSRTMANDLSKQYFVLCGEEGKEDVLIMIKYILMDQHLCPVGCNVVKVFKDKVLVRDAYSIQLPTLTHVMGIINMFRKSEAELNLTHADLQPDQDRAEKRKQP